MLQEESKHLINKIANIMHENKEMHMCLSHVDKLVLRALYAADTGVSIDDEILTHLEAINASIDQLERVIGKINKDD